MMKALDLFPDAPKARAFPTDIIRSADISECGQYRWVLRRTWRAGPYALWIMLNPSTADAETDDPTMKRVISFTDSWGYGSAIVVNLFPFRSPSPVECRKWLEEDRDRANQVWATNTRAIAHYVREAAMIVYAWGAQDWASSYVDEADELIKCTCNPSLHIHCLGKTASGSPKHPMARGKHRVPDGQKPVILHKNNYAEGV